LGKLAKKPDQNFTFFSSLLNLNKPSLREGGREGGTHVEFLFWGRRTKEAISS